MHISHKYLIIPVCQAYNQKEKIPFIFVFIRHTHTYTDVMHHTACNLKNPLNPYWSRWCNISCLWYLFWWKSYFKLIRCMRVHTIFSISNTLEWIYLRKYLLPLEDEISIKRNCSLHHSALNRINHSYIHISRLKTSPYVAFRYIKNMKQTSSIFLVCYFRRKIKLYTKMYPRMYLL